MTCPICNKPTVEAYKPFCSKRCTDVDLARWFNEAYSAPVIEIDDEPDEEPSPANDN